MRHALHWLPSATGVTNRYEGALSVLQCRRFVFLSQSLAWTKYGTYGVAFVLGPEIVVVSAASVVAEPLASVPLVIEVPSCRVQHLSLRAITLVFALEADGTRLGAANIWSRVVRGESASVCGWTSRSVRSAYQ